MDEVKEIINKVIKEIQEQQFYRTMELNEKIRIVKDLGFKSLDVAELIAILEMELGVDPFSEDISIMEVRTIGDLYTAYQSSVKNNK